MASSLIEKNIKAFATRVFIVSSPPSLLGGVKNFENPVLGGKKSAPILGGLSHLGGVVLYWGGGKRGGGRKLWALTNT